LDFGAFLLCFVIMLRVGAGDGDAQRIQCCVGAGCLRRRSVAKDET
jgi:hypothetical protein